MLSKSAIQQGVAQARAHQMAGRLDAAELAYRNLLNADPKNAELLQTLALLLRQKGDNASAVEYLRMAIRRKPSSPGAYYNLGNALADLGRVDDAIAAYQKAVDLRIGFAPAHSNFGALLIRSDRFEEAVVQYRNAIQLNPEELSNYLNLGFALRELKQYDHAIAALQKALAIAPECVDAFANLGACLSRSGQPNEAAVAFGRAFLLSPESCDTHDNFSIALRLIGRFDEAIDISKKAVTKFPDQASCHLNLAHAYAERGSWGLAGETFGTVISLNPEIAAAYLGLATALVSQGRKAEAIQVIETAKQRIIASESFTFQLAALGAGDTPSAPPTSYVVNLFNDYALTFDRHVVDSLHYVGHRLLHDAVLAASPPLPMDILDLGCGTGMCGLLFKPLAGKLIGIDLAPKMVEQARTRGIYDEVTEDDVTSALLKRPAGVDLLLAADVFIYVGGLDPVFPAAAQALRPRGLMAFTIESPEQPTANDRSVAAVDFVLKITCRYAHSMEYIERLASACGFEVVSVKDASIRMEQNAPVAGKVVLLRKVGWLHGDR